uniref:GtrA family protein n=1 Tax=Acetatifactor sp. TaxID=1872090 RepID=UPI0040575F80
MDKLIGLLKKYKGIISYLFFGVCTTVINIVVYNIFYYVLHVSNVNSNIVAWIVAVLFAFITNKLFVFDSTSLTAKVVLYELLSFLGCRLITGVLDLGIMYVTVDCLEQNAMLWKIITNVLVIILNYIASKLVIFKKRS